MTGSAAMLNLAEGLGARPDAAVVARSRHALARIESEMALQLKAIAALPAPADSDMAGWQAAKAAMEIRAREDAGKARLAYKSIIKLDELHRVCESLVDDCNVKALKSQSEEDMVVKPPGVEAQLKIAGALLSPDAPPERLDLSGLLLQEVPRSIEELSMLVRLDLSNNNLECLPDCVTGLVNLTVLDVHSNQLTSLPDSLGRVAKLKILNVSSNSLAALPDSIQNCHALEELSADFNRITRLPETVGFELVRLRKLSVHSNAISYLPSSAGHMTSLRVLDVHLNKLRCLPEDICRLVNLEYLNVGKNFNNFVGLPESIGGLRGLIEMDVSYNQIHRLPNSVGGMEKLVKLAVEGNPLTEPPAKVVEHGLEAIKQYLSRGRKSHGASWWLGHLVRCGAGPYEGGNRGSRARELPWNHHAFGEEEAGFSSPRSLFSPRRLLSSSPLRNISTPRRTPRRYSPLRVL